MEHPRPDDKNWTWVLERPCPACRFDAGTIARHVIGATLRTTAEAWREVLSRGALVRQRPPGPADRGPIWSALEYGCHVRDVFGLFEERLGLMLTQDDPTFLNWDQDATAIAKRYWEDDPAMVCEALVVAGGQLATAFDPRARRPVAADWDALRRRTLHCRIVWALPPARPHPPLAGCGRGSRGTRQARVAEFESVRAGEVF